MSVHSVSIAKYRLKNLLAADRMHCTADLTEQMKNDLYHGGFQNIRKSIPHIFQSILHAAIYI